MAEPTMESTLAVDSPASHGVPVSEANLDPEGSKTVMIVDPSADKKKGGCFKWCLFIILIIIVLALIIGLSVGLTRSSRSSSSSNSAITSPTGSGSGPFAAPTPSPVFEPNPTPVPIGSPTPFPTAVATPAPPSPAPTSAFVAKLANVLDFLENGGYATSGDLSDTTSPQYLAAEHMAGSNLDIPTSTSSTIQTERFVERWVIMVLFHATNGNNWALTWNIGNSDLPFCNWQGGVMTSSGPLYGGIFCNDDLKVEAIQFITNRMGGTLPTELGLLTDMNFFNLARNSIGGTIPTELALITNLELIDLIYNRFTETIPAFLGDFSNLQVLGLSNNLLSGSLPANLASATALEVLAFDDNFLTGSLAPVNALTRLESLYAEDNAFDDTLSSSTFANLNSLEDVDLSTNNLKGGIPVHFFQFVNLTILDLHANDLTGTIPTLPANTKLELLALQRNDYSGTFPSSFSNLQALTHLDLTSTPYGGTMPTVLAGLTRLEYLFLADTSFTAGTIPDEYAELSLLEDLSLKDSGRTGSIPTWLGSMDNMLLLDLDSNQLTGSVPTELGDMTRIIYILLNRNELTGTIPTELGFVRSSLRAATFDHNDMSGNANNICALLPSIYLTTDCDGSSPVICDCCTDCCDPADESCHSGDLLAQFDPIWEYRHQRFEYSFNHYNITDRRQLSGVNPKMWNDMKAAGLRGAGIHE